MRQLLGWLLCWAGHHDPRLVKLTGAQINRRGIVSYTSGAKSERTDFEQLWALDCQRCGRRFWTGGTSELVRTGRLGIRRPVE